MISNLIKTLLCLVLLLMGPSNGGAFYGNVSSRLVSSFKTGNITPLPSVSFISGALQDSNNLSAYTWSAADIGTAATTRHVVLIMVARRIGASALSSFSVQGISGTILTQVSSPAVITAIGIVAVPTGTTGDIVMTLNGSAEVGAVARYAVYDLNSASAVNVNTSTAQTATLNVNTSLDGVVIAGGMNNPGSTATSSGVNEDLDTQLVESGRNFYAASVSGVVAATPRSVSISWSASNDMSAAAVSLR